MDYRGACKINKSQSSQPPHLLRVKETSPSPMAKNWIDNTHHKCGAQNVRDKRRPFSYSARHYGRSCCRKDQLIKEKGVRKISGMCYYSIGKEMVGANPAHRTYAKHKPKSYSIKHEGGYKEFHQVSDRNANGILGL